MKKWVDQVSLNSMKLLQVVKLEVLLEYIHLAKSVTLSIRLLIIDRHIFTLQGKQVEVVARLLDFSLTAHGRLLSRSVDTQTALAQLGDATSSKLEDEKVGTPRMTLLAHFEIFKERS